MIYYSNQFLLHALASLAYSYAFYSYVSTDGHSRGVFEKAIFRTSIIMTALFPIIVGPLQILILGII